MATPYAMRSGADCPARGAAAAAMMMSRRDSVWRTERSLKGCRSCINLSRRRGSRKRPGPRSLAAEGGAPLLAECGHGLANIGGGEAVLDVHELLAELGVERL